MPNPLNPFDTPYEPIFYTSLFHFSVYSANGENIDFYRRLSIRRDLDFAFENTFIPSQKASIVVKLDLTVPKTLSTWLCWSTKGKNLPYSTYQQGIPPCSS